MKEQRLVLVHAHPDDEAISTGGTIARYSDDGAHVCLITCTNGELGEIAEVPELGPADDLRDRLGEIRRAELEEACRHLGKVDLRMLGFHDSGMAGTPENDDPKVFVNQKIDDVVRMIAPILREVRPQVLVTYNESGFYGHPDHIRAHEAALAAMDAAADPAYEPELGPPHAVSKVYYTAFPKSLLRTARDMASELGWENDAFAEDEIEAMGTDDDLIAAALDVAEYIDRKYDALRAHRTQLGTTQWALAMPEQYRVLAFGIEHYVLARSASPRTDVIASDLFVGIE
ncbi:MAG: N-acetyl-1-D-myo-inositol-2-amino-2-deoxy-alpha-D-glucopyranoside deacetylase [Actinomycetota bacterium]